MPLSWNEIRDRSVAFVREWESESSEHAEAKTFWDEFFQVFGVIRRRLAAFEKHVKNADGVAFLFELYQKITSLLPAAKPKPKRKKSV